MGIRAPDSTAMNLLQAGILAVLAICIALPITVQSKDCGTWMSKSSWSCCSTSNRCGVGQGDCDRDSDCQDGLICGNDNCRSFIPGVHPRADCCIKKPVANGGQDIDASILLIGGSYNSMQIWNPYLSIDYPQYKLPSSGSGSRAANFYGKYYSCGGSSTTKGECFSTFPGLWDWVSAPRMKVARVDFTMTTVGDKLVVTGGMLDNDLLDSVEILQPKGKWTNPGWTLNAPTSGHCAVAWSSTELVIIGGIINKQWTNTVTMYDVTTGKSQGLPNLPRDASFLACTKYKGNIVAGRDTNVWMLKGDKWVPLPTLKYFRNSYVLKQLGGKLYALAGGTPHTSRFTEVFDGKEWSVSNISLAAPYLDGGAIII